MHPVVAPYDQGRSRRTFALIAATCFMFFAIWAWVFFVQKPRVADGKITAITAVPFHSEFRQAGTPGDGGTGGGVQSFDEVYVWVAMDMTNLTRDVPLYETSQRATLTLPTGEEKYAYAASPSDVAKVRALPKLRRVNGELLPRELTLKPEASARGLALFAFPVTQRVWDTRREFSVNIAFQWQRDLPLREVRLNR